MTAQIPTENGHHDGLIEDNKIAIAILCFCVFIAPRLIPTVAEA